MHIDRGFNNNYNEYYDNIVYINFDSIDDLLNNLGKFIIETKVDDYKYEGILLHKMINIEDNDYAFRIYRDYNNVINNRRYDDKLISILQSKQSNIKLTSFPIGVVCLKGYVIGQIIVYYNDRYTLKDYLLNNKDKDLYKDCYMKIVNIIEELINNGIFYRDIHSKNFMVSKDNKIDLIDFDLSRIDFKYNDKYMSSEDKLIYMFNYFNSKIGLKMDKCSNMDEVKERILKL